jgi:glycosyltransferase involved in cell wall biosynthesis
MHAGIFRSSLYVRMMTDIGRFELTRVLYYTDCGPRRFPERLSYRRMRISVITVVFNNARTISDCLASVAGQTHPDIEHIVIDGGSTDGTIDLVRTRGTRVSKIVSEPDRGMYDALNKGLALATGEAIAVLNSDDVYADDAVLAEVAATLASRELDSCYGDVVYVQPDDLGKVVRRWKSGEYRRERFRNGWMPPHTACFIRKTIYDRFGSFDTSYDIASDYEILLRFLYKNHASSFYIPKVLVKMRTGGRSAGSLKNIIKANAECYQSWRRNGLRPNPARLLLKPLSKLLQLRRIP